MGGSETMNKTKSMTFTTGTSESDWFFFFFFADCVCFRFVSSDSEKTGCAVPTEIVGILKAILAWERILWQIKLAIEMTRPVTESANQVSLCGCGPVVVL